MKVARACEPASALSLYKQWGLVTSKTAKLPLIAEKYNVASQ